LDLNVQFKTIELEPLNCARLKNDVIDEWRYWRRYHRYLI